MLSANLINCVKKLQFFIRNDTYTWKTYVNLLLIAKLKCKSFHLCYFKKIKNWLIGLISEINNWFFFFQALIVSYIKILLYNTSLTAVQCTLLLAYQMSTQRKEYWHIRRYSTEKQFPWTCCHYFDIILSPCLYIGHTIFQNLPAL